MSDTPPVAGVDANPDSPEGLVGRYVVGAAVLREAIAGLDAEALRARPIAGKMSSLEVAAHICDSDQFMCDRMKRTIATERPLIIGVESADYPGPLRYHDRDPKLDIRMLEVQREQMAADLARLAPDAWTRTAVHSENGLVTLLELLEHAVDHLESHVVTIAEKRAALGL
jgi:uncharacterized damage-inducible protein DinB